MNHPIATPGDTDFTGFGVKSVLHIRLDRFAPSPRPEGPIECCHGPGAAPEPVGQTAYRTPAPKGQFSHAPEIRPIRGEDHHTHQSTAARRSDAGRGNIHPAHSGRRLKDLAWIGLPIPRPEGPFECCHGPGAPTVPVDQDVYRTPAPKGQFSPVASVLQHHTWLFVAAIICLFFVGCASPSPKPPEPAPTATPTHAALTVGGRINAVVGRPLVVAINPPIEGRVEARLDDGRLLLSRPARVTLRAPTDADPWLGPNPQWTSEPLDPAALPSPTDTWLAIVETPIDAAGHDILINGERIPLHWLPPTSTLPKSDADSHADAWAPTRPAAMPTAALDARRFADESRSPFTRWRYRLLAEGLHPDATPLPGFADPIAEAFAQQEEDRWRVALAWLWGADPDLAARVRRRLSAVIEFAPGQWAPAWSANPDGLRRLLDDSLNPSLSPQRRAAQAARWLEESPPMAAWVVDDGGRTDPTTGNIQPTIAVASLLDRSTLAWVSWSGEGNRSPDLQPLPPMTVREFTLLPHSADGRGARHVQAHVGRDSITLPTLAKPIPARPPGLALRPFAADWSMDAVLLGQFAPPDAAWETAALLYKRPDATATADTPARSAGWEILIESKSADALADERVDIHLGPTANPLGLIRVWRDGRVENFSASTAATDPADAPIVIRSIDRWSARIPIPPTCIEPGNLLRLGLTRLDARGQRSAVPRAIMPWHDHPARVAVDLTSWEK